MRYLLSIYDDLVLGAPRLVLVLLAAAFVILGFRALDFRLDASTDSLILDNDEDLIYYKRLTERYHTEDLLVITYSPHGDLFDDATLADLASLRDDMRRIPSVSSVLTVLDVPLLRTPPVPVRELRANIKTLGTPGVDKVLARAELHTSPVFRDLLVSPDLGSTALLVNLVADSEFQALSRRRSELQTKVGAGSISAAEARELARVEIEYEHRRQRNKEKQNAAIRALRGTMKPYRARADLFLGGVPMIAHDVIAFIRNDLKVFGLGLLAFLVLTLTFIFRRLRWVVLTVVCCVVSVVVMMGLLSVFGWEVTVISSNFVSLQLIVTMALAIHVTVRYNEVLRRRPGGSRQELVTATVRTIFKPCLYTTLTTIAGFSSLVFCNIRPVINFGWMMAMGLIVSLIVTFLLFPAILLVLPKAAPAAGRPVGSGFTALLARAAARYWIAVFTAAAVLLLVTVIGTMRLKVENSFINYFKKTTEIYQGMRFIDRNLGGTTPLDVIISLDGLSPAAPAADGPTAAHEPAGGGDLDDFDEFDEFEETSTDSKYWYTAEKMELVTEAHAFLDALPGTGKVLSLATLTEIAKQVFGKDAIDSLSLVLFFDQLPPEFKDKMLAPYVSPKHNQLRLVVRVRDSEETLRRDALLKHIHAGLVERLNLRPEQVRLAGIMVLYNNMLQSLFRSQIQTLGATALALLLMFMVLFRSLKVSLLALLPNLMASVSILGIMGLLGIPLDMMTITIAAISIGIAVDNSIHYIHRFKHELRRDGNYIKTMFRCHGSIGHAMYYTSITIIIGFSILALSNFVPTVLFGLLTGVAMALALGAALTVLPLMLVIFKPFGPHPVERRPPPEMAQDDRQANSPHGAQQHCRAPSVGGGRLPGRHRPDPPGRLYGCSRK